MTDTKSKPAPLETEPGKQMDDNIDDLGRKQDGSRQEQPGKAVDGEDPDYSPTTHRGPDGRAHKTPKTEAGESVPNTGDDIQPSPTIVRSNPD